MGRHHAEDRKAELLSMLYDEAGQEAAIITNRGYPTTAGNVLYDWELDAARDGDFALVVGYHEARRLFVDQDQGFEPPQEQMSKDFAP